MIPFLHTLNQNPFLDNTFTKATLIFFCASWLSTRSPIIILPFPLPMLPGLQSLYLLHLISFSLCLPPNHHVLYFHIFSPSLAAWPSITGPFTFTFPPLNASPSITMSSTLTFPPLAAHSISHFPTYPFLNLFLQTTHIFSGLQSWSINIINHTPWTTYNK